MTTGAATTRPTLQDKPTATEVDRSANPPADKK